MFSLCMVVVCALFWHCISAHPLQAKTYDHPNIILVLADDLGYGDPGCYNPQSKIPTPNMDRLASEGMRFIDAHSPGAMCVPTRYGLLTGRYPCRVQCHQWRERPLIEPGQMTLGSLLSDHGYATAMVGKWHLGVAGGRNPDYSLPLKGGPVDRGFDSFFGLLSSLDQPPYFFVRNDRAVEPPSERIEGSHSEGWRNTQGAFWRKGRIAPGFRHTDVLPRICAESLRYISTQTTRENPFFLYVALPSPHTPWLPTKPFQGSSATGMYGDYVAMVDDCLGQILGELDHHDLAANTLVFFTSDNGPVWFPENIKKYEHRSAHELRGKKMEPWEGGHRIPFIARWPGGVHTGSVSDAMICQTDMLATFAELMGGSLPDDVSQDSFSLLSVLLDQPRAGPARETLVVESPGTLIMREGPWKLIPHVDWTTTSREVRKDGGQDRLTGHLYNLDNDLEETNNLWETHPDKVSRLLDLLESYL